MVGIAGFDGGDLDRNSCESPASVAQLGGESARLDRHTRNIDFFGGGEDCSESFPPRLARVSELFMD
ncbi:Uncharacterised protein [Mycobacterium tuberculosis]|nr:Uncharacterised protein [Mycobacterium tuberculosis]